MATPSPAPSTVQPDNAASPERISALAEELRSRIRESVHGISEINLQARVLAINAQIEASRAGDAGRAFAVVGQEMATFSTRTQQAATTLDLQATQLVLELADISRRLGTDVRGQRLCDLALTNIDLIDRNLYERSCDCRWWATDAAFVAALESGTPEALRHASERMGVILKAYTVYFDIVLADRTGTLVANGRPQTHASVGTPQAGSDWFRSALATASGDEFGFHSVHPSPLASGQRVLVYSCKVCRGGIAQAEPLGVLGVVFNWDGLAQKIVHDTPIEAAARDRTRVCIVDDAGNVLADSRDRILAQPLRLPGRDELFAQKKNSATLEIDGRPALVAHAQSPGFETYRTGWHSLIVEELR